jgi:hypothetical protein
MSTSPTFRICFIECLVETAHIGVAIVGPFALRIGVMQNAHEAQVITRRRPFEHLLVAVGVAKGKDRTPANEFMDAHRLAGTVLAALQLSRPAMFFTQSGKACCCSA